MKFKNIHCKDTNEVAADYKSYLQTKHWKQLRREVYELYNHECVRCHDIIPLTYANIHHRKYKNLGRESIKDLILYCNRCHTIVHNKKKKEKAERLDFTHFMARCNRELTKVEKDKIIKYITKKYFSDDGQPKSNVNNSVENA